jgi:6-phosphogluconate dehydrogenase
LYQKLLIKCHESESFQLQGDIIIDGGNSEYQDTRRRCDNLEKKGILYVGSGISGGEEGARHGPSLMPGGNRQAWYNQILAQIKLGLTFIF